MTRYGPTRQVICCLGHPAEIAVRRFPDAWMAGGPPQDGDQVGTAPGGLTVRLTRSIRGTTADVTTRRLAGLLGDGSDPDGAALSAILPPFAAAHRAGPAAPFVFATDWLGLRQLYWWRADGVAAVSTSARALAALAGVELDPTALAVQSRLGWQVGSATPFAGVYTVDPGSVAVLQHGLLQLRRYAAGPQPWDLSRPLPEVVEEMAAALREVVGSYLADHPKTVLQLSGGQDSRVLLAAVPPEHRGGLPAMTLDTRGGAESRVAARLADHCDLHHVVHWLGDGPPPDAATAYRAATGAARALEAMASPLALGALALIETGLEQGHRLSGTGGETARGFYYPGQPRHARTAARLVRRLADWRLFTNEAVDPQALEPDFAATARSAALAAIEESIAGYHTDWLRATDEFYLWQRVRRWAGAHDTAAAVERHLVNPLLDRRVMMLALASSPADKRNSRLTARLIERLDPALARVPLDTGLSPAHLVGGGVRASAGRALATAGKAVSKVRQRLRHEGRAQYGAAGLGALVITHWRATPELLDPVRRTGVVQDTYLDELLDGRRSGAPATVAFLLNLLMAVEAGTDVRQGGTRVRPGG
jgi:asparagine synthase (glutamine-hydrolysing)